MISASGSNPLQRYCGATLILWVIRVMNDPRLEVLADFTLIMLRVLHLGGARRALQTKGCVAALQVTLDIALAGAPGRDDVTFSGGKNDILHPFLP